MCNDLDDIRLKFEELCSNREMDMPILSDEDIRRLPNIFQLIEILKKRESQILIRDNEWENYSIYGTYRNYSNGFGVSCYYLDDNKFSSTSN